MKTNQKSMYTHYYPNGYSKFAWRITVAGLLTIGVLYAKNSSQLSEHGIHQLTAAK